MNQPATAVRPRGRPPKPQPATVGEYLDLVNAAPFSKLRRVAEQTILLGSASEDPLKNLSWLPKGQYTEANHNRRHVAA